MAKHLRVRKILVTRNHYVANIINVWDDPHAICVLRNKTTPPALLSGVCDKTTIHQFAQVLSLDRVDSLLLKRTDVFPEVSIERMTLLIAKESATPRPEHFHFSPLMRLLGVTDYAALAN